MLKQSRSTSRPTRSRALLESLESRLYLFAIVPNFVDGAGAWTAEEKACVNQAIADWTSRINFASPHQNDTIHMTFDFVDGGGPTFIARWGGAVSAFPGQNIYPYSPEVSHDVQINTFFLSQDSFNLALPDPSKIDMLTAFRHEIGHALGITDQVFFDAIFTPGAVDKWAVHVTGSTFDAGGLNVALAGPGNLSHVADSGATANDLMVPGLPTGTRRPISNLDVQMLQLAYGVTAITPQVTVVNQHIFYNNCVFDGFNPAINIADMSAIAPDKTALFPGGTAVFGNYSSYSSGLNGIMIDMLNLTSTSLSASDFTFKVGNTSTPASWAAAPAPSAIVVVPGAGDAGSARVEITWPDGAIKNQWLQITVNTSTGLAAPYTFYFGSAIGEAGNSTDAKVTAADALLARVNPAISALLNNPFDYNRDGIVNVKDEFVARTNQTNFTNALQIITVPAGSSLLPALAPATLPTLPVVPSLTLTHFVDQTSRSTRTQPVFTIPALPALHLSKPLPRILSFLFGSVARFR